jgi:hypothetical protein
MLLVYVTTDTFVGSVCNNRGSGQKIASASAMRQYALLCARRVVHRPPCLKGVTTIAAAATTTTTPELGEARNCERQCVGGME